MRGLREAVFSTRTALLVANLSLVWALPVLPAQDLPQHLSYARILADFARADLPFQGYYALPTHLQPYDSVYLLLAWLGRAVSLSSAIRLVMSAYVALMFEGFSQLVRACHEDLPAGASRRAGALASLLVWSPVVVMGFLQYFLSIPLCLMVVARVVRWSEGEAKKGVMAGALVGLAFVASIHLVAAGALALFLCAFVASNWNEPRRMPRVRAVGAVLAALGVTVLAWHLGGDVLGATLRPPNVRSALQDAQGFEFLNAVFRITWYDPLVTLNYVAWTVFGPFRWGGVLLAAVALAGFGTRVWWLEKGRERPRLAPRIARVRRAAVSFALIALLMPWGIEVPAEITYINFRMLSLAFALLLAFVSPSRFDSRGGRRALAAYCIFALSTFAWRAFAFGREAGPPFRLLTLANRSGVLVPLMFHGTSESFAKGFRLAHFLPMYFTVDQGGISSQFWARYTEHLPVGYVPGKQPLEPPDWFPDRFDPKEHLRDATWVLLEQASLDDPSSTVAASARTKSALEAATTRIACEGRWCLYRVTP